VAAVVAAVEQVEEAVEAAACHPPQPTSAREAFEAVLLAFSESMLADVTGLFAPGAYPPPDPHLENVAFETPTYSIDLPHAAVGTMGWQYQFIGSNERYSDGRLVFSVQTDADQKISKFLIAHDNDNFAKRVPHPKPESVDALVAHFFAGLSSFSTHESLQHTAEGFTFRILGDVSLLPHHVNTVVTRDSFAEFKEEAGKVFDFTDKSVRCLLQSQDEDSSASHCQIVGKHARVKFCLDGIVLAEAKDGLLTDVDFYIAGACDPKTKFEDDSERAERAHREAEKQEAKRREEERKIEKAKEREKEEGEKKVKEEGEKKVKEKGKKKEEGEKA